MCETPDPRDEIVLGARALRGLSDLVNEVSQARGQFDLVGPSELGELLRMVEERICRAAEGMEDYVPRK